MAIGIEGACGGGVAIGIIGSSRFSGAGRHPARYVSGHTFDMPGGRGGGICIPGSDFEMHVNLYPGGHIWAKTGLGSGSVKSSFFLIKKSTVKITTTTTAAIIIR